MPFFTDEELDRISIEKMIFHVVGPLQGNAPLILEEISPPQHTAFFLDRILSIASGSRFRFQQHSDFREELVKVNDGATDFAGMSRILAGRFQDEHKGTTKDGVFLVFRLRFGRDHAYAVVKYDHDPVVSYEIDGRSGRNIPNLTELTHTFVKKPEAMQKSALIRLGRDGDQVAVRDRSARDGITDYFRAFLGVRREYERDELTKRLHDAVVNTYRAHESDIPPQIAGTFRQRLFDRLSAGGTFGEDDAAALLTDAFGNAGTSEAIRQTFARQLKALKIDGESFAFSAARLKPPNMRRMITEEGIRIILPEELKDRVKEETQGAETVIMIRTAGVVRNEHVTEADLKRG